MQLVTDRVMMYDTMKDRRIGIPEVIEKFGVPPEKVVEVQALAGDSTDNVPGVPGIGVKTAAQLIVEYGDLEQLLFRATRDQAAEAARGADRECREGADLAPARAARRQGRARRAARRSRRARAGCAQADRVPEGDGVFDADQARRGIFADRSVRCRRRTAGEQERCCRCARIAARPAGRFAAICSRPQRPPPAKPRRQGRQGLQPQGHADLARRRAQGSRAETAGRSRQISDHPHAR